MGAGGWLFALVLRGPVSLVARRLTTSTEAVQRAIILASGPAEELVRLAAVLIASADLDIAYAIGLGWGGIEVIYALINGFLIATLLKRTDEEAVKARQTMEEMGLVRSDLRPIYGVVERIAATAVHIGFTLQLAYQPWLVLVTMPAHSLINYGLVSLMRLRISLFVVLGSLLIIGLFVFGLGLLLWLWGQVNTFDLPVPDQVVYIAGK